MSEQTAETIWQGACAHLRSLLHPDVFERWIAVIRPVAVDDQTLVLGVDNDFYQTWLEENYLPIIQNAVTATTGKTAAIRLTVTHSDAPASPDAALAAAQAMAPMNALLRHPSGPGHAPKRGAVGTTDSMLNPRFTFAEFIVGPSNNFAHAAAMAVAQAPAHAYNPLFIYGGSGLGKTHLMQAIAHHVLGRQNAKVCYLSSETFTNEYIDSLQNRTLVQFRRKYRGVDLLLIDDIHFLAGKERMQEEFFHTFNTLFDAHRQIVMTSDRPASEIQGLEQRLVSRFEWGQVAELQPPDYETRMAILHTKMTHHNMGMPEEAVQFIAKSIHNNVRRLEGALTRATSYAALLRRPLTVPDLERLLHDLLDQERQQLVTFEMILKAVADHYDVRLGDMTSKRRPQAIAVPRQIAMYLCRTMTPSSLPSIAAAFAKTHATVLHGVRMVEKRMVNNETLRQEIASLTRQLTLSR